MVYGKPRKTKSKKETRYLLFFVTLQLPITMVHKRTNGENNQMCLTPDNNQIIKGMKRFLVFLLALMAIVHTPAPLPIHKTMTRHPLQHLITLESAMKPLAKGPMPKPPISIFSSRLQWKRTDQARIEKENSRTSSLRNTLLPRLMSGEIDVKS